VVQASYGWNGGYGIIITIEHGGGVRTRYAHLSGIGVSVGQSVGGGQYIGAVGNSGRSTGSHLHFESIVGGRFTAPF
jgi:murein DD-endopeptidase MepM/ murein hydrolase activator NlpD